jgi:hypothetical protein
VMKHYSPTGRRNYGRPLKRLLDTWDRNGSTSGPTPWQIYDDDDDYDYGLIADATNIQFYNYGNILCALGGYKMYVKVATAFVFLCKMWTHEP